MTLFGCAHREATQTELESFRIMSLGTLHRQVSEETDVRKQFSRVCFGFFNIRGQWPRSVEELETFWSFAPPEPYAQMWSIYHGAKLTILSNGSLSVVPPDGENKLIISEPRLQEVSNKPDFSMDFE